MEKQKLLITFWLLFVPVSEMFWEKKFLMKSNASVFNEWGLPIVLIVPMLPLSLALVVPARSEKSNSKELKQPDNELMLGSS
eukprot:SAG31_NODE_223_length_19859_cov_14.949899_3_plen_82_part_00